MASTPFDEGDTPIARLVQIMGRLRSPGGCPWDLEQTHESIKPNLIEEAYEVVDAIDSGDAETLREELGDLLLQVVFHARMAEEAGSFSFQDVAQAIGDKLVRRHPHVFGDTKVTDAAEVLRNWDAIKRSERAGEKPRSTMEGVPRHLPALLKAQHVQARAARLGFDWDNPHDVLAKIEEEIAEVKAAMATESPERVGEELGDLLFAVVNLVRFQELTAEDVLNQSTGRFVARFQYMEERVQAVGRKMTDYTLAELEALWVEAKQAEKNGS